MNEQELRERVKQLEVENKTRRKEIKSLDEQLVEAKRAIETQYNLRQAVEAERDELLKIVEMVHGCHLHDWAIYSCCCLNAMERALQPAQRDRYAGVAEQIQNSVNEAAREIAAKRTQ